jgi:hypothetical protein
LGYSRGGGNIGGSHQSPYGRGQCKYDGRSI